MQWELMQCLLFTVGIKIFHDSNLWDFKWNLNVIEFTFAELTDVW